MTVPTPRVARPTDNLPAVPADNPCRTQRGHAFAEPDGYRVVLQQTAWTL